MRRVFKINEVVWFVTEHESGWGRIAFVNRDNTYREYNCSDEDGDIITITKEWSTDDVETHPSCVYQVAEGKFFRGEPVVWEHNTEIDYPFFCPAFGENCYHFEVE